MSDTDDTEDLLLIPPDFFLVHSEPEPPYYSIVDNLIKQVSNLQDRIEGIESMSDVSLVGSYLDHLPSIENIPNMFNTKNPTSKRYYSQDDLYQPSSTQSTPQKVQEKFRLNSLPNTPSVNRFSPRKGSVRFSSPQKIVPNSVSKKPSTEETEVLGEIDTFLSNVKTIQRNHAVRNLQKDFNSVKGANVAPNVDKYTGRSTKSHRYDQDLEETIHELDKQSERISTERRNEAKISGDALQERVNRVNAWQCGDNLDSVPDYGTGVRDHLYKQKETKDHALKPGYMNPRYQPESTSTDFTSTNTTLDKSLDSSSESTQLTAYKISKKQEELFSKFDHKMKEHKVNQQFNETFKKKNVDNFSEDVDPYKVDQERNELLHSPLHDSALNVLEMHKKLLESTNAAVKDGRIHKRRGINTLSETLGLLSLADIWGTGVSQSPSKLSQKLQEEKLRREHCEQLIQELQNGNLELQQKMAVAVKVDDTKNKTIQQFREALNSVSSTMEKLNEEKSTWDREMTRLKTQHSIEMESANQKVTYYEKEASKSLNLAHSNQEKMAYLEKKCSDMHLELQLIEVRLKEVQENYQREFEKGKQLADIISQKEIELKENKNVLNNAREEVSHSRKAVEVCQTEFTSLKDECDRLQTELRENKNSILSLNEQKRLLLKDMQTYKQNEKTLKDALEQSKLKVENTKVDLRNFYQGQLEIIVENKRKEMQTQLDKEKQNNLEEIKRKELSMAKTAANHIKDISDKCALETKLLEQKHQEEIRLYQVHLSQVQKEMENLQSKLAHLPEKRVQIAKQLQKVMETQWNEAMKMINGSPTPVIKEQQNYGNINTYPAKAFHGIEDNSQQHHQELRKDSNVESDFDETPVSSRGAKQSESEIQKYINMLLNRPPGNPITESREAKGFQNQQRPSWNPADLEKQNRYEPADLRLSSRDQKSGKPPWK